MNTITAEMATQILKIAEEIQQEWQGCVTFDDGLYCDFTKELLARYAQQVPEDEPTAPTCECGDRAIPHTIEMSWYEYFKHADQGVFITRADCQHVPQDSEALFSNDRFVVYRS